MSSLPAGASLTTLPNTSSTAIIADPASTLGDVPSCAFALSVSGRTVNELIFVGMDSGYRNAITAKLVADSFLAGAITPLTQGSVDATEQVFTKGTAKAAVETSSTYGITAFAVVG